LKNGDLLQTLAKGESLGVTLTHYVDFANPRVQRSLDVRNMAFDGEVFLESHLFDPHGDRKAFQQMLARTSRWIRSRVAFTRTPWWVSAVLPRGTSPARNAVPNPVTSSPTGLDYVRVHFAREMVGHLSQREMEFFDRIRALYGPVPSWEETLDETGPKA